MSKERFKEFMRFLRFDDKETRADRRKNDKLAAIREVVDAISHSCKKCYIVSAHVTIDEMLSPFRGKCPFRVYMPFKPARYGIKIWILADVSTAYCANFQVYLGKVTATPEKGQAVRVVKDLREHIYKTGRNVTTDNFFTDYQLAKCFAARKAYDCWYCSTE